MKRLIITIIILFIFSAIIWSIQLFVKPILPENLLLFVNTFIVVSTVFANLVGSTDFFQTLLEKQSTQFQISSANQKKYREILLSRVWDAWIEGVLHQSLYNEVRIALGLELHTEAPKPWDSICQMPERPPVQITPGTNILEVFNECGKSLVFVGEPGSGKTTELLELASQAIECAKNDLNQPAPVIFNLSSWTPKHTIAEWLVNELSLRYKLSPKVGKPWVDSDDLMFLLDGLDEVKSEYREQCVRAINIFIDTHPVPIVLCCRSHEFQDLTTKIKVQGVVLIQPVQAEKAVEYLRQADANLVGVYNRLKKKSDQASIQFIHTPLFFSILILAFRGASKTKIKSLLRTENYRRHLFDSYIDEMFRRRGVSHQWTKEQATRYLAWLATRMLENGQTVFYLDSIQPAWLDNERQRKQHSLLILTFISFFMGLIAWLSFGLVNELIFGLEDKLMSGLFSGLVIGLETSLIFGLKGVVKKSSKPIIPFTWSWDRFFTERGRLLKGVLKGGLIGGLIIGLIAVMRNVLFAVVVVGQELVQEVGLIEGLMVWLYVVIRVWLIEETRDTLIEVMRNRLIDGPRFGLVGGLSAALVTGMDFLLRISEIDLYDKPNEPLRSSFRSFMVLTVIFGLNFGLIFGLIFGLRFGLIFWPIFGLIVGLEFGGNFIISHFLLRYLLNRSGRIPIKLITFLEFARERIFLRRVGGGYIFIHRLILEHFAEKHREVVDV